jgi:hypothetical protein
MVFSPSAETVAYEEDPAAAALLLKGPDYSPYALMRSSGPNGPATLVQAAAFQPRCWRNLGTLATLPMATLFARGWGGTGAPGAIIFLHERISPAGHRRLLCVSYGPDPTTFQPEFIAGFDYDASAATPATLTKPPSFAQRAYAIDVLSAYVRTPPLVRVYAGQPDPTDPAHFTIRYKIWGKEDTLDGRLQDDDQITLTPRHSPQWPTN